MRSIGMRPAPRSMRRLKVCASILAPVLAQMRAASSSPRWRSAGPASNSREVSPACKASAAARTASAETREGGATGGTGAGPEPSFQAVSPGRISVATWPGGLRAAAIAAAPSAATRRASGEVRTHPEKGRAAVSMSEVSGASYCRW